MLLRNLEDGGLSPTELRFWAGVADWVVIQEAYAQAIAYRDPARIEKWLSDDAFKDTRTSEEIIASVIANDERRFGGL